MSPDTRELATAVASGPRPPDLPEVVASLVRPTTVKVTVESRSPADGSLVLTERSVTVRALLPELRAAVEPGGEAGGSGRGAGGLPIAVDVHDRLTAIHRHVMDALGKLGLRRRRAAQRCRSCQTPLLACRHGRDPLTGEPRIGTYASPCCSRHKHPPAPDPIADALAQLVAHPWPNRAARDAFADTLRAMIERAAASLAGGTSGYVHGRRCPACKAEHVTDRDGEHRGERHPALQVTYGRPITPTAAPPCTGTRCTGCGSSWSWDDMQPPEAGSPGGVLWRAMAEDDNRRRADRAARRARTMASESTERARLYAAGRPTAELLGLPRWGDGGTIT